MKLVATIFLGLTVVGAAMAANTKGAKAFSLFNVVKFQNEGCRSTSTLSSSGTGNTHRNGTCYTTSECQNKGGTAAGSCAVGFGVCCVFTIEDGDVNENCTYIRNENYPNTYTENTNTISYTINKCSNDVCYLRLDFENFNIAGPADTTEENGGECRDTFQVTTQTGQNVPTICGQNSGQHMYVDLGRGNSDSATLMFSFNGDVTNPIRQWEIKISQLHCDCNSPPNGCLQYHAGLTGRFTTFNYDNNNVGSHLRQQEYSVCIRQEEGFCCIEYMQCVETDDSSFTSGNYPDTELAQQDTLCTSDYIGIEASGSECNPGGVGQAILNERYCGKFLNPLNDASVSAPVCDCTAPFSIDVYHDAGSDVGGATGPNTLPSRGTCLTWQQKPCN